MRNAPVIYIVVPCYNEEEVLPLTAEFLGKKLIYLEAGSGANQHVSLEMIRFVSQNIHIPLIVGGGIRSMKTIQEVYEAGADLVVIGTAFENNSNFFLL